VQEGQAIDRASEGEAKVGGISNPAFAKSGVISTEKHFNKIRTKKTGKILTFFTSCLI
jgi:hypothetical protein